MLRKIALVYLALLVSPAFGVAPCLLLSWSYDIERAEEITKARSIALHEMNKSGKKRYTGGGFESHLEPLDPSAHPAGMMLGEQLSKIIINPRERSGLISSLFKGTYGERVTRVFKSVGTDTVAVELDSGGVCFLKESRDPANGTASRWELTGSVDTAGLRENPTLLLNVFNNFAVVQRKNSRYQKEIVIVDFQGNVVKKINMSSEAVIATVMDKAEEWLFFAELGYGQAVNLRTGEERQYFYPSMGQSSPGHYIDGYGADAAWLPGGKKVGVLVKSFQGRASLVTFDLDSPVAANYSGTFRHNNVKVLDFDIAKGMVVSEQGDVTIASWKGETRTFSAQ